MHHDLKNAPGVYKELIYEYADDLLTDLYASSIVARLIMQAVEDRKLYKTNDAAKAGN